MVPTSIVTVPVDLLDALTERVAGIGLRLVLVDHSAAQTPRYKLTGEPPQPTYRAGLSDREMQVLVGIAQGKSNMAIAHDLFLSEDTVKTHCRRLFCKLNVHDRAHAVAVAYQTSIFTNKS